MLHFLAAFAPLLLGMWIHFLFEVKDFKKIADLNPNDEINFSIANFIKKEWLNYLIFISCGVGFILYFPGLLSGVSVELKGESGATLTKVDGDALKAPLFFLIGFSGINALLQIFGSYKNTLFKQTIPSNDKP